jgi:group I intron endonuclease
MENIKRFGLSSYFSVSNLKAEITRSRSVIYRSLLKYGYSNFLLEILEYCESSHVILREQHYLNLLKPDYNILKFAASSRGLKPSKETKAKISAKLTGRTLTQEHIAKI